VRFVRPQDIRHSDHARIEARLRRAWLRREHRTWLGDCTSAPHLQRRRPERESLEHPLAALGAPVATGRGLTWVARPKGSYYAKPGTIEMRGFLIKKCGRRGSRGYSRVRVRVASTGGHFSRWYLWGGRHNLCVPEYAPGA
jgi:hypothetical protein